MNQLKDIYRAENRIIKTLPKMTGTASQSSLEQAFETMGEKAPGQKCCAIEGIIDEGKEFIKKGKNFKPGVNDAGLLRRTLNEEKQADKKLTGIAESRINEKGADA